MGRSYGARERVRGSRCHDNYSTSESNHFSIRVVTKRPKQLPFSTDAVKTFVTTTLPP